MSHLIMTCHWRLSKSLGRSVTRGHFVLGAWMRVQPNSSGDAPGSQYILKWITLSRGFLQSEIVKSRTTSFQCSVQHSHKYPYFGTSLQKKTFQSTTTNLYDRK